MLIGGAAAWPLAAHAQQQTMPVIGFLGILWPTHRPSVIAAPIAGAVMPEHWCICN